MKYELRGIAYDWDHGVPTTKAVLRIPKTRKYLRVVIDTSCMKENEVDINLVKKELKKKMIEVD